MVRVHEEINLHFQESRRPHGKTRGGRIAGYLTDTQRSQAGWIGALKCEVVFERALSDSNEFIDNPGEKVLQGFFER
jgi:hypothetical protein